MKQSASASLRSLQPGTLVVFVDASGPLEVQQPNHGDGPWSLQPGGGDSGSGPLPRQLPAACVFTVLRNGDAVGFKSLMCVHV
jgi:hypothetical protein